jgi:hypothetical protein
MSARGHRPKATPASGMEVGAPAHFSFYGVGEWTTQASRDPADTVIFDMAIDSWIANGFPGMRVGTVSGLRNERKASR